MSAALSPSGATVAGGWLFAVVVLNVSSSNDGGDVSSSSSNGYGAGYSNGKGIISINSNSDINDDDSK